MHALTFKRMREARQRIKPRLAQTAQLRQQAADRARRARLQLVLLVPLVAVVVWAYQRRVELFGLDEPVRIVTVVVLVMLGWALARAIGRVLAPTLLGRLDRGTAGTVSFLIRLVTLGVAVLVALRIAGIEPGALAVGGAFTAVVVGLAAQQTLGHLIAGTVLLSARPFKVGDRIRLQAGGLAGQVEGVVTSLGLLYTTLAQGEDSIMVPNSVVLSAAAVPLREPAAVDLRARLRPDVKPSEVQEVLEREVSTPTRAEPHIGLEEVDADEVIMRIAATPARDSDGPRLADEILAAVNGIAHGHAAGSANGHGRGRHPGEGAAG